jgi:uncharacterized protein
METFNPYVALLGGIIIGFAAVSLLYINGRVCGISGMVADLVSWHPNLRWSGFFLAGMVCGGFFLQVAYPQALAIEIPIPYPLVFIGGLLVGFGTRMGGGCTSGHGVCGIGLTLTRSFIATVIFLAVGILTATILYHFILGDPQP